MAFDAVHAAVTPNAIDVGALAQRVRTDGDGAVCCFTGHVRGTSGGRSVAALDYDCYDAMAVEEMRRIGRDAVAATGASALAVEHRTGRVPPGEASVAVVAAAPHRGEAFDACRRVIDAVKRDVPIWKLEHGEDGSTWVEDAPALSHVGADRELRMVDVSGKPESPREAVAEGEVRCEPGTVDLIAAGAGAKGDVLTAARIAGVMAAKRTAELIPLCHPLGLTHVDIEATPDPGLPGIRLRAVVRCTGPTGVEMEALTAVTVAGLTVIDMAKSADRWMSLDGVGLVRKEGGRSGLQRRPDSRPRSRRQAEGGGP